MPETADTGAADTGGAASPDQLLVRLQGFEGPLDLLLEMARGQKLDLANISILALVDQYLAVIEGARRVRLELAADWLVMAAWLAWLKSRLLLPDSEEDPEAEVAAELLTARLRDLAQARELAVWLTARPMLGRDVWPRGAPESLVELDRSGLRLDVASLLRAYLTALRRSGAQRAYRPRPPALWSVQDALERLGRLLGSLPDWSSLEHFLPATATPLERRGAMASTLIAGLEMARSGTARLRQEQAFGPIQLRGGTAEPSDG